VEGVKPLSERVMIGHLDLTYVISHSLFLHEVCSNGSRGATCANNAMNQNFAPIIETIINEGDNIGEILFDILPRSIPDVDEKIIEFWKEKNICQFIESQGIKINAMELRIDRYEPPGKLAGPDAMVTTCVIPSSFNRGRFFAAAIDPMNNLRRKKSIHARRASEEGVS
jgi:hypothetical protein